MSFAFWKKTVRGLLRIMVGVPIVSMLLVGFLFAVLSVTWTGRSVGLGVTLVGGIFYCTIGSWNRDWFRRRRRFFYTISIPLGLVLLLPPALRAPDRGRNHHCAWSSFLDNKGTFHQFSPWNVIPEIDQIAVTTALLPLGDPYVDLAQGRRIRALNTTLYRHLEADSDFHALGSVMGTAYRQLVHLNFRTGHYYVFLPDGARGQRLPCIVFLHGLGGNRKVYLWIMSRVSTRCACAVVAPSFGMGNWDRSDSARFVVDVTKQALVTLPVDPQRVFLAGYSNGAMGVTRAAIEQPDLFGGLIYISPVTEDQYFTTPEFLAPYRQREILFLHGADDRRIPRTMVNQTVATLRGYHCNVRIRVFDAEDHYLLLSRPEAIVDEIADYVMRN